MAYLDMNTNIELDPQFERAMREVVLKLTRDIDLRLDQEEAANLHNMLGKWCYGPKHCDCYDMGFEAGQKISDA